MNNDRPLNITYFSSRKDPHGQRAITNLAGLTDAIQNPRIGTETAVEYHAMPKAKRDDLKDVGGFALGTFKGDRRNAQNLETRSALVYDVDNPDPHFINRLDGYGVSYVLYHTRSSTPNAPRYRFIVLTDRDMTPDEYEAVARKFAHDYIDQTMTMLDPTTYEPSRLMYLASHCRDMPHPVYVGDKAFLSVDGVLATYTDWHDQSQWPRSPNEQKRVDADLARAKRQQDPESKSGTIGTFCRLYNIPRVMTELIPGVYDQCDNNRYTFTGGSTTGGAVLYENGKFLFSHHATDPAAGKLLNAFDLCRIHLFGELDDVAPPGAFGNQLPSFKAMIAKAENLPDVKHQMEEERGAEVLADFGGDIAQQIQNDPDRKAAIGRLQDEIFTTDILKQALGLLGINTKLNIISNEAEITGAPRTWSSENTVNLLPTRIRDFLKKTEARGVSKDAIMDSLAMINDEQRFNPVLDRLYSARWDGVDRLPTVYAILGQTDTLPQTLLKKWLHQGVAMAHNDISRPYGADGVLTLTGTGGIGKTSFFRWLAMEPQWFRESVTLDPKNKDESIKALGVWIAELGELEKSLRADLPWLKGFLTQTTDNIRAPYARSATNRPRRTSFCGTVNQDEFLIDPTGNRRFWTVPVKTIDLDLMSRTDATWLQQLWAQALAMYTACPQGFRLTPAEREALEAVNNEHSVPLPYEEEVLDRLDFGLPVERWAEVSASQIAEGIYPRPDSGRIGRVLTKLAKADSRVKDCGRRNNQRIYLLPVKLYGLDIKPDLSASSATGCQ